MQLEVRPEVLEVVVVGQLVLHKQVDLVIENRFDTVHSYLDWLVQQHSRFESPAARHVAESIATTTQHKGRHIE